MDGTGALSGSLVLRVGTDSMVHPPVCACVSCRSKTEEPVHRNEGELVVV